KKSLNLMIQAFFMPEIQRYKNRLCEVVVQLLLKMFLTFLYTSTIHGGRRLFIKKRPVTLRAASCDL
ncbi:hypothetical protein, partial [Moritella sp. Urea-trap-13]|uniref:hypothetical protein n=1 Tax=Moritella sp. Urea-trap-13 TaxID=2058327 RepID=UPI001E5F044D